MICVFDCETIPDLTMIGKFHDASGEPIQACEKAFEVQKERTGSNFLPVSFHEVVSISAVIADDFGRFEKVSSIEGANEKEILTSFLAFINRHKPRLVSYNGRGFDLPMLMTRALKYNLSIPAYFDASDKWSNYRTRFVDKYHLDLLDNLQDFGAVRGLKLDEVCSMAGLPGKYDVHGDEVYRLYFERKIKEIKEYCESDVLNTYWLFLKYELLRGNILKSDYASYLETMRSKLSSAKSYTKTFDQHINDELHRL